MDALIEFLTDNNAIAHGYCLSWYSPLLWLHILSDVLIALSYYSIPISLAYFVWQRKDLPYPRLFLLFGVFILACGTTHLMSVLVIWLPAYWLDGVIKSFTALVSVSAAVLMLRIIPHALQLPSSEQLCAEIMQRNKVELALVQSETKFRTLFECSADALLLLNEQGFLDCNSASLQLFGFSNKALLLTKHPAELSPEKQSCGTDSLILAHEYIAKAMTTGSCRFEWLYKREDTEEVFPTEVLLNAVMIDQQWLIYMTVRNIIERKNMELELKRSNEDLEQFAYAVSHDMRQPLRMVSSYLGLIEQSLAGRLDEEQQQYLRFAIEGGKRMDAMILSLLEYSRVGNKHLRIQRVSSRMALDEALVFLKPDINSQQAEIVISGVWSDVMINTDELVRLLQNLIANALKYHETNQAPHIEISATIHAHVLKVSVRDNGIGIRQEQMNLLFKVFSRLQTRSRFEGTGIGLALCRKIVEHYGGKIGVESKGEGQGSVFWFELPMAEAT